jgi:formylglycine-generating enzyme required for sulfatase activity
VACEPDDEFCPCEPGEPRCGGGNESLEVLQCDSDRANWSTAYYCNLEGSQCDPTLGTCFELLIDETEVTRRRYRGFLATLGDSLPEQPTGCREWNVSFEPDPDCVHQGEREGKICTENCEDYPQVCIDDCGDHPQVCVDWCDALAYCDSLSKRLCGRMHSGNMVGFDSQYKDPGVSEWMNACSAGGQFKYGHGDDLLAPEHTECTYTGTLGTTYEVGTRSGCVSNAPGYRRFHDLSGNVAEWENSCRVDVEADAAGREDVCRVRGGSFDSPVEELECEVVPDDTVTRDHVAPTLGFRCCAGP